MLISLFETTISPSLGVDLEREPLFARGLRNVFDPGDLCRVGPFGDLHLGLRNRRRLALDVKLDFQLLIGKAVSDDRSPHFELILHEDRRAGDDVAQDNVSVIGAGAFRTQSDGDDLDRLVATL